MPETRTSPAATARSTRRTRPRNRAGAKVTTRVQPAATPRPAHASRRWRKLCGVAPTRTVIHPSEAQRYSRTPRDRGPRSDADPAARVQESPRAAAARRLTPRVRSVRPTRAPSRPRRPHSRRQSVRRPGARQRQAPLTIMTRPCRRCRWSCATPSPRTLPRPQPSCARPTPRSPATRNSIRPATKSATWCCSTTRSRPRRIPMGTITSRAARMMT